MFEALINFPLNLVPEGPERRDKMILNFVPSPCHPHLNNFVRANRQKHRHWLNHRAEPAQTWRKVETAVKHVCMILQKYDRSLQVQISILWSLGVPQCKPELEDETIFQHTRIGFFQKYTTAESRSQTATP
jgi:hypothetical protein